jgi:hypothetical protein
MKWMSSERGSVCVCVHDRKREREREKERERERERESRVPIDDFIEKYFANKIKADFSYNSVNLYNLSNVFWSWC